MKKLLIILGFWLACVVPSMSIAEGKVDLTEPTEAPVILGAMQCGKLAETVGLMAIANSQKHFKQGSELFAFMNPRPNVNHQVLDLAKVMAEVVIKFQEVSPDEHFDGAYEFCKAFGGNVPEMTIQLSKMLGKVGI